MLKWTAEEKVLLDIKKIIAIAWRMNSQQLHAYYKKLSKKYPELLPGHLGRAFLQKLDEIAFLEPEAKTKIWPELLQDADWLLNLMQKHQDLDEKIWKNALCKLEAQQDKTFRTELGRAFVLTLQEKLGPDKKQAQDSDRTMRISGERDLEKVADWLMEDSQISPKAKQRKTHRYYAKFPDGAAIAVSACMSLCFLSVWLYGQAVRNQSFHNVQKLKAASAAQQQTFTEKEQGDITTAAQADSQTNESTAAQSSGQVNQKMTAQPDSQSERPKILAQYREMAKEYPGLFGWLQIPDTQIDLPVMQPLKEKDFYLHHDFTGAVSAEGALFADPENNRWPQDDNTVIYGHNMKNGHIFGDLDLYEDIDYFQSHREIHFDTIYETGVYEAAAVLKTRILNENEQGFRYYQFFQYNSEEEFQQCLDFIRANQLFDTGCTLEYGDRILMLSTCEYSQENGRLVIVARKI